MNLMKPRRLRPGNRVALVSVSLPVPSKGDIDNMVRELKIGIPVATTVSLGFDRLPMVLLDAADVSDVLLFPASIQYLRNGEDV